MEVAAAGVRRAADTATPGTPPIQKEPRTSGGEAGTISPDILQMFAELRVETKEAINNGVDAGIDKAMSSLATKMGERMSRMEDRVTAMEVESRKVRAGQDSLMESFKRLEALVSASRTDEGRSQESQSSSAPMSKAPAGSTQRSRDGDPEASVLLFFPFEVRKAFMKVHIQNMFESAPDQLHKDAILTLPPAGKTGGLRFPTSEAAHSFNEWLNANPYTFTDKTTGEVRRVAHDVAKSVPRKIRSKAFAPVYEALLGAGYTKDDIVQTHADHDTHPTTTLLLAGKNDRVHKAGTFRFAINGSRGRIVAFDAGPLATDSPKLANLIRDAAGLEQVGGGSS